MPAPDETKPEHEPKPFEEEVPAAAEVEKEVEKKERTEKPKDVLDLAARVLGLDRAEIEAFLELRDKRKVEEKIKAEIGDPLPGAPPRPEEDPRAGDKTPAVVKWYRDWWPKEYERRYKGRRTIFSDRRHPKDRLDPKLNEGYAVDAPEVFSAGIIRDPRIADLPRHPILPGGLIDTSDPNLQPLD